MLTRKTAIKLINDFISACAERNITFQKVILFGSVASGRTHQYSDIDVAFVSDQFTGNPFYDLKSLNPIKIADHKFLDIEPLTFTPKEFESGDDTFLEEVVKKTGIEIPLNN